MTKLLEDRTAVIYGAGGAIGGAVAQAFAREGTPSLSYRPQAGAARTGGDGDQPSRWRGACSSGGRAG
jgi:NAD(P)-dependent dehydrogenase (short-subunit alcohol dehydrogenase family)